MLWRVRNSRGRPKNTPAAFIQPCRPTVAKAPPRGEGWALHSRVMDQAAVACAFDLLMLDGDDIRRKPLADRKEALRKPLRRTKGGIQYVEHVEGDGAEMFKAICKLGLEGIVSKKITAPYKSGPSRTWIKVKNPRAPAATRALDGTF